VRAWIAAVATVTALLVTAAAAVADCTKTSVSDLEDEVMCPVCGTSLALAREAPLARRQRAYIDRLVRSCRSKDEIKAALVVEFGDSVLALPSKDGFNLSAYVAPLLAMLVAGAATVVALARWRRAGGSASGRRPDPLDPTDVKRLDEELRRVAR
jgi:cytochrome c-type biogenesis protein CcmH